MSFFNLSPAWVIGGIAGLAALLYVMQRLRVRYRTLKVPSAMFWQQAAQEAPVRVFTQKFRHWLAYLLTLAICALMWVGFAGPKTDSAQSDTYYVLYLDGSAAMARGDDFSNAVSDVQNDLGRLPSGFREVIWGGAYQGKLLGAHEEMVLFEQRVANLQPEAVPASLPEQLRLLERRFEGGRKVEVRVYGQAEVSDNVLSDLANNIKVVRATDTSALENNRGITALGFAASVSGNVNTLDVLIGAQSTDGTEVVLSELALNLNGNAFVSNTIEQLAPGKYVVRDVPAEKGIFEVSLTGSDSLPLDDSARIRLPDSPFIKVAVSDAVPAPIKSVIDADPVLVVSDLSDAKVAIRASGESFGNTLPSLEVTGDGRAAFDIRYTGNTDAQVVLQRNLTSLGLNQIDATGLATETNREIGINVEPADSVKTIGVWGELLNNRYNFTQSKAFPVFVVQSLRWLADHSAWHPYLQAGQPLFDQSGQFGLAPSQQAQQASLNAMPILGGVGELDMGDAKLQVSLTNADVTQSLAGAELEAASAGLVALDNFSDAVLWLMALLLILLAAEWVVYQRGLMP